jgi:hypothetical protein
MSDLSQETPGPGMTAAIARPPHERQVKEVMACPPHRR